MKFVGIEKKEQGKFITRYDVQYETVDGIVKNYEMISRNGEITDFEGLHGKAADAVVIIATDEADERILIDKEFRLAPGEWVYNFPAGLIDPGETPEVSARRELMEETGLELYEISDTIGTGEQHMELDQQECKEDILITPGWYTKAEVRELLKTEKFAARTQAFCYVWSRQ